MKSLDEYRKERDLIIDEIGDFDEEDFVKSGISLEEYTSPNEETIKKHIQEQEKHDIALDKLSVKEYSDPFKG